MKIPIALAPDSLAREATDVLLQKEIPNLAPHYVRTKDPIRVLELPAYSYSARRLPPLLAQGLKPVIKLRASPQFDRLQEARDQLLRDSRRLHGGEQDESNGSKNLQQRNLDRSQKKLDEAMIDYCAEIWRTYENDLKGATFKEGVSSGILSRHKEDMTKAWGRDAFAFAIGEYVWEALMYLAELASGLQLIGIPQNFITFARISVPLGVSVQLAWHNYNNFTVTKHAEQLVNLIGRE